MILDARMASQALSASSGQVHEPPKVPPNSTLSGTLPSDSSQENLSVSDISEYTLNNSSENVKAAPKKLTEKEDDDSKCPKCAVPCCKRTGERLYQTTFFPCPLAPHPSSRLWAKAMGVKVILKNMYICEDHFQLEDDLENYLKFKYYPRGQQRFPRFKKGVVPWKFPKCGGSSSNAHYHRVPFSKTEYYKRQTARINKARGILSANENNISSKGSVRAPQFGYREASEVADGGNAEHLPTSRTDSNMVENVETMRIERSLEAKQTSEGMKNSTSSEDEYFNMLNGDLSTLIAHVQPAICSWEVSEVRPESSKNLNQVGCGNLREEYADAKNSENMGSDSESEGISSDFKKAPAELKNGNKTSHSELEKPNKPPSKRYESTSSRKSDEESDDEVYMTPSEDEMNGDQDTSDTDFTLSSEESWDDHEFVEPTRRSARNRSQKTQKRPDRDSPPIVLRSRAKKRTDEQSPKTHEPVHSSPKSGEETPQPDKPVEAQNSDSGVSCVSGDADLRENNTPKVTTTPQDDSIKAGENNLKGRVLIKSPLKEKQLIEGIVIKSPLKTKQSKEEGILIKSPLKTKQSKEEGILIKSPLKATQSKEGILIKSPLKKENESKMSPTKPKSSHTETFLEKNENVEEVIRSVSLGTSDSESASDLFEDNQKTESILSKSSEATPSKVEGTSSNIRNLDDNPKWRLRESKSPIKGARLNVDMEDTVAEVFFPESDTIYSYKKVNVEKKPGSSGTNSLRRGKQEKFLVVRDGDQVAASTNSLPKQICGLISNMRNTLGTFFGNLDDLKSDLRDHHSDNPEKPADACLAEPYVDRLLDEFKKFPDLLELEMAQFAMKCEKFYDQQMEKSLKNSKKIRWCNFCQNAARFHCCFSAAYCSRICQSKDWGKHHRHCGQSRMLLDDPDLKLSPLMANRLKSLEYYKPTIGASMSNFEELCLSFRQPSNGKRVLASKNHPRSIKRSNGSGVITSATKPKIRRTYLAVKSFQHSSSVAGASIEPTETVPLGVQSTEMENPEIKTEPLDIDMEVEQVEPPPRRTLVKLGHGLVNKNSPTQSKSASQQVSISIPPNVLAGLPSNVRPVVNTAAINRIASNTTAVNSALRLASVAMLPRTNGGNSLVLPKNTSPGKTSAPVTLRCRTVVLPTGETQYIPVDGQTWSFKPNAQLVVKHVNQTSAGTPVTVIKQATTSGSILITRPTKPTYSKFIPIAPTQTVNSTVFNPEIDTTEPAVPPLTPRLPKLTPVMPKHEPAAVRTLDSSELDKILSTDHLKEAFNASYSSNILRP